VLPDLRPLIAESMVLLAEIPDPDPNGWGPIRQQARWLRAMEGAETLRWCAEREGTEEDAARLFDEQLIDDLEARLDRIVQALDDWRITKLARPAKFRDRLAAILDN
jgi:hypothetical protein